MLTTILSIFFIAPFRSWGGAEDWVLLLLLGACQSQTVCQTAVKSEAARCTPTIPLAATSSLGGWPAPFMRKGPGQNHLSISPRKTCDRLSMARYELAGRIGHFAVPRPGNETTRKAALDLEAAIACDEPPWRLYLMRESLGLLYLRWGDPPEARKALALGKRPHSPFMKSFANEKNK